MATEGRVPDGHPEEARGAADGRGITVQPLYRVKAEFFKTLGHPVRIRVLELLTLRDHAVSELLKVIDTEPASLSQQLAVLRRSGLVQATREGSSVVYSLAHPQVEELLDVARAILTGVLSGQVELLDDLRSSRRGAVRRSD